MRAHELALEHWLGGVRMLRSGRVAEVGLALVAVARSDESVVIFLYGLLNFCIVRS